LRGSFMRGGLFTYRRKWFEGKFHNTLYTVAYTVQIFTLCHIQESTCSLKLYNRNLTYILRERFWATRNIQSKHFTDQKYFSVHFVEKKSCQSLFFWNSWHVFQQLWSISEKFKRNTYFEGVPCIFLVSWN